MRLMTKTTTSGQQIEEWVQSCADALAARIDEPVLGACRFTYSASVTRKLAGEHLGFIPGLIAKQVAKKRAGGLPQQFVMVLTPSNVRAYGVTSRYGIDLDPACELLSWPRESLGVETSNAGMFTKVTFRPAQDEPVTVQAPAHESTERFLALLTQAPGG